MAWLAFGVGMLVGTLTALLFTGLVLLYAERERGFNPVLSSLSVGTQPEPADS